MAELKFLLKCATLAVLGQVFQKFIIGLPLALYSWDTLPAMDILTFNYISYLLFLKIIVPVLTVFIWVGILGSLWLRGKKHIGFILACFFGFIELLDSTCLRWFAFDYYTFFALTGCLLIVIVGSLSHNYYSRKATQAR